MKLIGMLDSPYVRRVAITLNFYGMPYEHQSVSVFRHFDKFKSLSPLVKAPSLLLNDGSRLIDSSLIIHYLDKINSADVSLNPTDLEASVKCLELVGIALVANEKSVQAMYERTLRTDTQRSEDWLNRVAGQLVTAYQLLEEEIEGSKAYLVGDSLSHADIAVAVAWGFTQWVVPDLATTASFPKVDRFAQSMEELEIFERSPIDHE